MQSYTCSNFLQRQQNLGLIETKMDRCCDSRLPALQRLLNDFSYISWGGNFDNIKFTNTCVLDSFLAALHFSYMKYQNIKLLLDSNSLMKKIMKCLDDGRYNGAKHLWWNQLPNFPDDEHNVINFCGNVKDHLPVLSELVCVRVDYHQATPSEDEKFEKIRPFRQHGDVITLSKSDNQDLILIHRDVHNDRYSFHRHLPLSVMDDHGRTYELQFLLLGKDEHMVMCFRYSDEVWLLFDSQQPKSFQPFDLKSASKDYKICLAGYIYKLNYGIAETGVGTGPFPINQETQADSVTDQQISGISETGVGATPLPINQETQPDSVTDLQMSGNRDTAVLGEVSFYLNKLKPITKSKID